MEHQTYSWKNKKGQKIFGQSWTVGNPRAVICQIHGQSDHSSRFEHVAKFFNENGISFFAADLIGHGHSEGQRGHVRKFYEYTETVELLYAETRKLLPDIPLFIYGHSMGGNICIHHSFYTKENITGYIITSPWIRLAFEPPAWKVTMGNVVKSIFPSFSQSTGLNVAGISRDPEVVERYRKDPLVHGKITASGFFEIMTQGKNILLNAQHLKFPMLVLHGSADAVIDHTASREFAALRPDLITYQEFEGLYHEIHNEPEKQLVFNAMLNWINQKLK